MKIGVPELWQLHTTRHDTYKGKPHDIHFSERAGASECEAMHRLALRLATWEIRDGLTLIETADPRLWHVQGVGVSVTVWIDREPDFTEMRA